MRGETVSGTSVTNTSSIGTCPARCAPTAVPASTNRTRRVRAQAYEAFFERWTDADEDIPLLVGLPAAGTLIGGIPIGTGASAQQSAPGGYVIEADAAVATAEPGPHNGGGETVGYSFFADTPGLNRRQTIWTLRPSTPRTGHRLPAHPVSRRAAGAVTTG
jgi:hypothetical protein